MMFRRNENKSESPTTSINSKHINIGKIIGVTIALVILVAILTFFSLQIKGFYDSVTKNWNEIKFAYEKPTLVKSLREEYQTKQEKLEQSFLIKEETVEQKLIEQVVNKLKTSK